MLDVAIRVNVISKVTIIRKLPRCASLPFSARSEGVQFARRETQKNGSGVRHVKIKIAQIKSTPFGHVRNAGQIGICLASYERNMHAARWTLRVYLIKHVEYVDDGVVNAS